MCILPPCIYNPMCFSFDLLIVICISDFPVPTLVCVLADSGFGFSLCVTIWYFDPCLLSDFDYCLALNKSFFHFTPVCIWVFPFHLPLTVVTMFGNGLEVFWDHNDSKHTANASEIIFGEKNS